MMGGGGRGDLQNISFPLTYKIGKIPTAVTARVKKLIFLHPPTADNKVPDKRLNVEMIKYIMKSFTP